jgi:hypothetical protein
MEENLEKLENLKNRENSKNREENNQAGRRRRHKNQSIGKQGVENR